MYRDSLALLAVAAVIAVVATAGVAYAMQSSVSSTGNTAGVEKSYIDICDDSEHIPITEPFSLPEFVQDGTVTIEGYCLTTSGPGTVTVKCDMKNGASWVFIDSMWISIDNDDYAFGKVGTNPDIQTGVPASFSVAGEEGTFYSFTITIKYADIDPASDPLGVLLTTFPESVFLFTFESS